MCVEFPIVDMAIVMWSNIAIFLELKKVTAKTKVMMMEMRRL